MSAVAAVDCGTNAVRMLVAQTRPDGSTVELLRRMEITRLGRGVDRTGRLDPVAVARTLDVLVEYAQQARDLGASAVRLVTTSATRDAADRPAFVAAVAAATGLAAEVISGTEEAALCYAGAVAVLDRRDRAAGDVLVVDVGGGSTEVARGRGDTAAAAVSVDVGAVRLTERHLHHDPPSPAEVAALRADARAALARAAVTVPMAGAGTVVATAGTATTLAALALGLPLDDPAAAHGARVPSAEVSRIAAELAAVPRAARAAIPGMHPGRVDVIAAGAAILDEALAMAGAAAVVASERDILDGIVARLAGAGFR